MNARKMKEGLESAKPAHCIVRKQFGAVEFPAVHSDASLTQVGERQMSNAAERGGRLCLFVARSALSLALQALNGTPQSDVTPHESYFSCVQPAPSNYKILSRQNLSTNNELSVLPVTARVIRIMPNTPMTVGAGACIYTSDALVTQEQCKIVENLLRYSGICEKVPEYLMDSLGALLSCGPAYMYIVIEALADGAVKQGVPRQTALKFAAQTMIGSGKMVLETGKHPGLLKDDVCSPGGSTICGVTAIENGKLR
ncbi:Pyrroline-5-carboxylate reductase [Eumeta japonica]|uniref:Pyrroline-5-carboxylate reductase n=1 Tax=Eumeta variegata TaxID=151549 RepID=A0A4C1UHZ2_EUMVA|nr:Pyrroline-5-carboxylate reductase [Eumeta japonica]